jgi:hypothetical protein
LHEGKKGLNYIKKTELYATTDKYIKYEEKIENARETIESAKDKTVKLYGYLNDKVYNPLKDNLIVIYD